MRHSLRHRFIHLLLLSVCSVALGQPSRTPTPAHRVSVFAGSILVPADCTSVTLESWADTWSGQLEGPCPAITFVAGHPLRANPAPADRSLYETFVTERVGTRDLLYGIKRTREGFTLRAHIGLVNFSFNGPDRPAVDAALGVLRTFGACPNCPWPPRRTKPPKSAA